MKATSFKESNTVLGAGGNPNTNQLTIAIAAHPDPIYRGRVMLFSKWKFSPEDLQRINETGEMWIGVMATPEAPTQPPILPCTENPFEEFGYEALDLHG